MQQNVGDLDRIARLVVGSLLVLAGIAGYAGALGLAYGPLPQALASVLVAVVGLIVLATGLTRSCLIYSLLGVATNRKGGPAKR